MFLKKLITSFLIPPGFFVSALFLMGLFHERKRWKYLLWITGFVLWALSTAPVSHLLLLPLEEINWARMPKGIDSLVILGGGIREYAPDISGLGVPSDDSLCRIVLGARVYRELQVPIIVSGGIVAGEIPEARIMKKFLVDLGVAEHMVILEEESRDTDDNISRVKEICIRMGFKHPAIVTSAYHMKRALLLAKSKGLEAVPVATDFKTWPNRRFYSYHFLPEAGCLRNSAIAIKEYMGMAYYGMKR